MRIGAAILLVGSAFVTLAREAQSGAGAVREAKRDAAPGPADHARLLTLPVSSEPSTPVTEERRAPTVDPTRAAVLALLEVVDDDTRDALLGYYVKAGFPTSDLPQFSRTGGRVRLTDDTRVRFHILARPGETLLVDPAVTDIHNLHGEDVNIAVPPGHDDVRFEAPREPGLYRYRCDVHNEVLGWVLVASDVE